MADGTTAPSGGQPGAGDMVEIFYAPTAVFERRRGGSFGLPLVVLAVLAGIFSFLTSSLTQAAMQADAIRGMQPAIAAGKMTAEQAASSAAMFSKVGPLIAAVFFLVTPFIVGFVAWLVSKMAGVKQELGVAVMVGTFSMFPRLVGLIVSAGIAAMTPEEQLTSATKLTLSPAHFIDPLAHPALALLSARVDLFLLWAYIIIGIGMYVTARRTDAPAGHVAERISKGQAIAIGVGTWLILSLPAVWGAARAG